MKKLTLLALCGMLSLGAFAQKSKKAAATPAPASMAVEQAAESKSKMVEWPQLQAFHKVMAATFHPAEKGDFKPIRTQSREMLEAVKNLIGNPFPEPYRTADMKVMVAKLEEQVTMVNKLVESKADDKELMATLNETHEVFHKIAGMCRKEGEEHSH